jgi:hypothetical protein
MSDGDLRAEITRARRGNEGPPADGGPVKKRMRLPRVCRCGRVCRDYPRCRHPDRSGDSTA